MAERKIDGDTYRVQKLPAKRSLVLFARLGNMIGPAMPDLVNAIGARDKDEAASNAAALAAMSALMSTINPEAFASLIEELVELAEIQQVGGYVPVSFDGHMSGRLDKAVSVVAFVLKEQFGDFFTGLLAGGKAARTAA